MIRIIFKDLDPSELAKELAEERIQTVIERFPELAKSKIRITLSMENSPSQPGPDSFSVKVYITGGKYGSVILAKSAGSLYAALAEVVEHLLERLNRYGDRVRVKRRRKTSRLPIPRSAAAEF